MTEQNPYQTPTTDIGDGKIVTDETELASPWIRLLASILDTLILMLFIIPIQIAMGVYDGFPEKMEQPDIFTTITVAAVGVLIYAIVNGFTLHRNGQTIGKLICKIKIVKSDFSQATLGRIVFRRYLPLTFVTQVPVVGLIIALINPLLIFRQSRQCLHDNIADTLVIKV